MLSEHTKKEVKDYLFDVMREGMFGDGMEDEYIRHGMSFVGLENMTDQDLVNELLQYTGEDEELVQRAQAEMSTHKMLTE